MQESVQFLTICDGQRREHADIQGLQSVSRMGRVDCYEDVVFCTPGEELHVDMRAMAVDDEQAPVSTITSFGFAESIEHLGEPLVSKPSLVQPVGEEAICAV